MSYRTVLLHSAAESCDPDRGAPCFALGLAEAFSAHLEALVFELDMVTPRGSRGRAITAEAIAHLDQRNAGIQPAGEALSALAAERGIAATIITERSHIHSSPEIATDHARIADIAVAGVSGDGLLNERTVAEALIFQSGRPVVVVPESWQAPFAADRMVVAWDYGKAAARALADALPLLRHASEVTLVVFGDDKDFASSLTDDELLAGLQRRGVGARLLRAERGKHDIGEALRAVVADAGADLLVMGGFGHSRFRDFVLGSATRTILAAPPVPTLISH